VDIDLNALRSYTQATYAITEEYLASLSDEQLRETVDLSGVGLGIPTVQWILSGVICQDSCQDSSNDMVGGFELPAPCLWLFVVAFCGLQLRVRCLYLRVIFYLHLLALLHRCYMERLWGRW